MLKSQIYKNLVEKLKNKDIFKLTLPVVFGYIPLILHIRFWVLVAI
ncbi:hypothetical protein CE91St25_07270 [Campylobacter ureolyticus]|nr:hypothetical protein [Campylobacter ureolyticus]GKH60391.1 hypothetical protein CE91St25_07270 [Campylobacter ureolyticus]